MCSLTDLVLSVLFIHLRAGLINPHIPVINFDENEKLILEMLTNQSDLHMDVLSIRTGISASKMNVILFNLEMKNAVKHIAGKRYRLATSL